MGTGLATSSVYMKRTLYLYVCTCV